MIFYFSGTGNSAWVARQLAEGQNEELLSIAMEIDRNKGVSGFSGLASFLLSV